MAITLLPEKKEKQPFDLKSGAAYSVPNTFKVEKKQPKLLNFISPIAKKAIDLYRGAREQFVTDIISTGEKVIESVKAPFQAETFGKRFKTSAEAATAIVFMPGMIALDLPIVKQTVKPVVERILQEIIVMGIPSMSREEMQQKAEQTILGKVQKWIMRGEHFGNESQKVQDIMSNFVSPITSTTAAFVGGGALFGGLKEAKTAAVKRATSKTIKFQKGDIGAILRSDPLISSEKVTAFQHMPREIQRSIMRETGKGKTYKVNVPRNFEKFIADIKEQMPEVIRKFADEFGKIPDQPPIPFAGTLREVKGEGKPQIPKELESLAVEARKYKNVEEFSKTLDKPMIGKLMATEKPKEISGLPPSALQIKSEKEIIADFYKQATEEIISETTPTEIKPSLKVEPAKKPEEIKIEEAQKEIELKASEVETLKSRLAPFTSDDLKLFHRLRQQARSQKATTGDIETLRKKEFGGLIEKAVERVRETINPEMDDTEALEFIKNLPTQTFIQKTESELNQLRRISRAEEKKIALTLENLKEKGEFTTRKIKRTKEFLDFVDYAETLGERDIKPAILTKEHKSLTIKRVAEKLDNQIHGQIYNEFVKPVIDARVRINKEAQAISQDVKKFKIIEGTTQARDAFRVVEKKMESDDPAINELVNYSRTLYDDLIDRMNEKRAISGLEPIAYRQDYVTHIHEINVLSEIFGDLSKVSKDRAIKQIKKRLIDEGVEEVIAFQRAKRIVEGATGLEAYIDAKQPVFKYAKERVKELAEQEDIISALKAYIEPALRYIHQAENVAKNKAYKDVLPFNAKFFVERWNTHQVAGVQRPTALTPGAKRAITLIRNTIGQNTILGNVATMAVQLTSVPPIVALAGPKNFVVGLSKRLYSYLPKKKGLYEFSQTHTLRSLSVDIGLGDSLLDSLLVSVGKYEKLKNPAARVRQVINIGRDILKGIMEGFDQLMVGTAYESFYHQAITDLKMRPEQAFEYADTMTGKTQADYFKEALPPILDTVSGRALGQFGTYGMNQWEMLRKDLGKEFVKEGNFKTTKNKKILLRHWMAFLVTAFVVDYLSEKMFKRTPYEIKPLVRTIYNQTLNNDKMSVKVKKILSQTGETVLNYVPFLSSTRYGALPPIPELTIDFYMSLNKGYRGDRARDKLLTEWPAKLLFPFGGQQIKKTLGGIESVTGFDIPGIKDVSKTKAGKEKFDIDGFFESLSAFFFGAYGTKAGQEFLESSQEPKSTGKIKIRKRKRKK